MADDVTIRPAVSRADFDACVALQRAVWGMADLEVTSSLQFLTAAHAGAIALMAEADGRPVGFVHAFPALRGGVPYFHSDILTVLPEWQSRGVGVRLKWAQRDAALERGVNLVTWIYDPLQARHANLNLRRLGGVAAEFFENFYGITSAALHHGLPTDRLLVRWALDDGRVKALAREGDPPRTIPEPPATRINDVKWQAGWPVSSEPRLDLDEPGLLLEIPPEWDVLSQSAPRVAEDWHGKVRRALRAYFGRGYAARDFAPTEERGRRRPLYVLVK